MAGLGSSSIQDWKDVHDEAKFLVWQERVKADKYDAGCDEDLQALVQGNTKGHEEEAGRHGPRQRWVPVPQDWGTLAVAKELQVLFDLCKGCILKGSRSVKIVCEITMITEPNCTAHRVTDLLNITYW